MRVALIAVGTRMPAWVEQGFAEYASRMPRECRLELVEIPAAKRTASSDLKRVRADEGERVLKAIPRDANVIALDERGDALDSAGWSKHVAKWLASGRDTALLVGGPDGHADAVLARAQVRWALSKLTLPHALVRVLVAEQLYRAWTLLTNHPYHRA
jgi:23S rRNA (pseudouridine1915-N3)-methyltransferase